MSNSLIKGIKFPDIGVRDVVIAFANHCLLITDKCGKELFYGEYVEIPSHGRLIDADVLIKDLQGLRELFPSSNIDYFGGVISLVKNSPTIIEAEGVNR